MITIWYGDEQTFGSPAVAQRWINILGRVENSTDLSRFSYGINGGPSAALSWGPDRHRLAAAGDFNVEIDRSLLREGENRIGLHAEYRDGARCERTVVIRVNNRDVWPLPYSVEWEKSGCDQTPVQIVDGLWERSESGLRVVEPYYDRTIAIGDPGWENYEINADVVFHGLRQPGDRDGGNNVIHIAVAMRWPGHDVDEHQPHRKWYPLGITAEFRLDARLTGGSWRMLAGGSEKHELDECKAIAPGAAYRVKGRVQDESGGATAYRAKLWPVDSAEPPGWDIEYRRRKSDMPSGCALLIAHYSIVTFGDISVVPIA